MLGYVRDARRFPTRDRFASDNGTAPIEVSGGDRVIYRLSRRGNRQLDHAIHMAAVTQISRPGSEGRAYYQRTIAEGMGRKAALRALKRRISYTLHQRMIEDARRHDTRSGKDPGGQPGNDAVSNVAGSHLDRPALRNSQSRASTNSRTAAGNQPMLTSRPAPASRPTSRSAAGVHVEPRPGPRRGRGQERQ